MTNAPGRSPPGRSLLQKAILFAAISTVILATAAYYRWFRISLDLTSDPGAAEVRIDGQLVGRTPLRGLALSPGLHRLELSHSHYAIDERQLGLHAGQHVDLHVQLVPGRGKLALYSNPRGAWVEIDGQRQGGVTPLLLDLPSGPHEVAMGMDERRAASEQVVVSADQSLDVRLDLNIDPHGSFRVDAEPADARISLPGTDLSYQPGVRLPIGEYPVRVVRPGYVTRELRLQVRYGDNRYPVVLERAFGRLDVRTEPADSRVRVRYRDTPDSSLAWRDHQAGAAIPVGPVEVRVSAMGRRSAYRRMDLSAAGATLEFALEPMTIAAGSRFRDDLRNGDRGPEMVVVPPGELEMGGLSQSSAEGPRRIRLTEPFAVSVSEVTAADYRRFVSASGRAADHRLPSVPDGLPVTHVDFADAGAYAEWLTVESGHRYRLLSEAEWEYMARAGSRSAYFFGDDPAELCRYANVGDLAMRERYQGFDTADCNDGFIGLAPVRSFDPNAFGIHDVHGNAAEWVLECGLPDYSQLPEDGTPVDADVDCPTHGVRGGSWDGGVSEARSNQRSIASSASGDRGIRLLREL